MRVRAAVIATTVSLFLAAAGTQAGEIESLPDADGSPLITVDDNGNPEKSITFDIETGAYAACSPTNRADGTAKVTNQGCKIQLQEIRPGRRVIVEVDACAGTGQAWVNIWADRKESMRMKISDSNVTKEGRCSLR